LIAAVWVYFFLPEVKGRSLEEIDEMFQKRLPARKFRKYVCTGRAAIESKRRNASIAGSERGSGSEGGEKKGGMVQTIEHVWGDERGVADVVETAFNVA
jgi:MFS transporter, SP family, sugar:H+ symporter